MLWIDRASSNMNESRIPVLLLATCCLMALCGYAAAAEPDQDQESADLAKTVQNPLANLVTLPFQLNYNRGVGVDDRTFFNMNVQPVIPYPGEKWNIITRTIIPINSVPVGTNGSVFGMGDMNLSIFWSPAKPSPLVWGVGPALVLPTASDPELLGSEKWSIGPTGVIFYGIKQWTVGAVASNVWSVAGNSARDDVNFLFAQWFVNYNFGKGWALGTAPIITCDWESTAPGDQCTVPWGLQVSKVTHFGARPVNLIVGYYENSHHPTLGSDSQFRMQINFLFPQKK